MNPTVTDRRDIPPSPVPVSLVFVRRACVVAVEAAKEAVVEALAGTG